MTALQQIEILLGQLPEKDFPLVLQFLNQLMPPTENDQKISNPKEDATASAEQKFQAWMDLREKTLQYSFEDIDTAKAAVLDEKYTKYL